MTVTAEIPDPAYFRAELARRRLRIFEVAAAVHVHPTTLGRMLAEHRPMPPEIAQRLREVIERHGVKAG